MKLEKIAVSRIMLILLLFGMITLAFNVQPAKSDWTWTETIYIRADGSIEPDTAPISTLDNVTYTLTDNIVGNVPQDSSAIAVERDNIVVDGAEHTLQGTGLTQGLPQGIGMMTQGSGVTIKNMEIKTFYEGIRLHQSSNSTISSNNITNIDHGIWLYQSSNNTVSGNRITSNYWGILLDSSSNNTISSNNIKNNGITGIYLDGSSNDISGNSIASNDWGIYINWAYAQHNKIYHNDFISNGEQVHENAIAHTNIWDDGYPSGGNYWSNYAGIDANGDGIGDTPYVIDENNQDRYPLMDQLTPSEPATPTPSGVQVGVKAGDFIRYEYAITGAPSSPLGLPQWAKIEFLSIEEGGGTFRITMHYTDGREYNDTGDWSFKSGSINLGSSFMGIVIPSNSTKGDMVHMIGGINATIAGETTKMCAGISRTVVYSSFYQDYPASQFEYYWDKATGVMVEASLVSGDVTAIVTTIETNMWGTSSLPFYLQWWFYVAIAAVVALLVGAVYFLKKRKPPAPAVAPALPESTQ